MAAVRSEGSVTTLAPTHAHFAKGSKWRGFMWDHWQDSQGRWTRGYVRRCECGHEESYALVATEMAVNNRTGGPVHLKEVLEEPAKEMPSDDMDWENDALWQR